MQKVVEMTEKYLDEVQAKPGEYSFCIGYGYDYEEAGRLPGDVEGPDPGTAWN